MRVKTTREAAMIDRLCFDALGTDAAGVVEETCARNPGLAAELRIARHALALGRSVDLPEPGQRPAVVATVKLWD